MGMVINYNQGNHPPKASDVLAHLTSRPSDPPESSLGNESAFTFLTENAGKKVKDSSSRMPAIFDMHMADELLLKRTCVIPNLTDFFAAICDAAVDLSAVHDFPDQYGYARARRVIRTHNTLVRHTISNEVQGLYDIYAVREKVSSTIASQIFAQRPDLEPSARTPQDCQWPKRPLEVASGGQLLRYDTHHPPSITKAQGDGYLHFDHEYIAENVVPDCFNVVDEEGLSPYVVWEFKDAASANLYVLLAMRDMCREDPDFAWKQCQGPGSSTYCGADSCVGNDGVMLESGRKSGFDSACVKDLILEALENNLIANRTLNSAHINPNDVKESHRRAARMILQQVWSELVAIDGTVVVINNGNFEVIGIRHRETQTLFLSDVLFVARGAGHKDPPHLKVRTGMLTYATWDVAARGKLLRLGRQYDLLPYRYRKSYRLQCLSQAERSKLLSQENMKSSLPSPEQDSSTLESLVDRMSCAKSLALSWDFEVGCLDGQPIHSHRERTKVFRRYGLSSREFDSYEFSDDSQVPESSRPPPSPSPLLNVLVDEEFDSGRPDHYLCRERGNFTEKVVAKLGNDARKLKAEADWMNRIRADQSVRALVPQVIAVFTDPTTDESEVDLLSDDTESASDGASTDPESAGCLFMEHCGGMTPLSVYYRSSVTRANALRRAIEDGLQRLHAAGYVHGNLHPADILVEGSQVTWRVKFLGWSNAASAVGAEEDIARDNERLRCMLDALPWNGQRQRGRTAAAQKVSKQSTTGLPKQPGIFR